MNGISDTSMQAVEWALNGVSRRADVHSQNISNVSTPGYRASRVDFESHLRMALETGRFDDLREPEVLAFNGLPNQHGNDVELETEMVGLLKNNLMQDSMVASYNFKMNILRSAIGKR